MFRKRRAPPTELPLTIAAGKFLPVPIRFEPDGVWREDRDNHGGRAAQDPCIRV
jgi:hypothetical protein